MPKAKQYIWNGMGEHLLIIQLYIPILVFELLFRPIFEASESLASHCVVVNTKSEKCCWRIAFRQRIK